MVEKDCDGFSKICKKDWKPLDGNPSIFYNFEKTEKKKDNLEYLMIGDKEAIYQTDGKIIKENIEKVKKLKSFEKFNKANSIEM